MAFQRHGPTVPTILFWISKTNITFWGARNGLLFPSSCLGFWFQLGKQHLMNGPTLVYDDSCFVEGEVQDANAIEIHQVNNRHECKNICDAHIECIVASLINNETTCLIQERFSSFGPLTDPNVTSYYKFCGMFVGNTYIRWSDFFQTISEKVKMPQSLPTKLSETRRKFPSLSSSVLKSEKNLKSSKNETAFYK